MLLIAPPGGASTGSNLTRLMEDLLSLSRLEASPPLIQTINAQAAIENALSSLFDRAEAAGLTLTLDAPDKTMRAMVIHHVRQCPGLEPG